MIRKLAPLSSAILTVVLLYPCAASAQTFDIAGGYAYRNEDGGDLGGRLVIEKGWFGAAGFNLNDSFGVFGQLSQHKEPFGPIDVTLSVYGGGPRVSGNQRSGVTYFAQLLLGGASVKTSGGAVDLSESHFAMQPAVGVDIKAGGTVGVRFSFAPTYIKDERSEHQWAYHIMVGIVFRGG
jgi:hypothetical protein